MSWQAADLSKCIFGRSLSDSFQPDWRTPGSCSLAPFAPWNAPILAQPCSHATPHSSSSWLPSRFFALADYADAGSTYGSSFGKRAKAAEAAELEAVLEVTCDHRVTTLGDGLRAIPTLLALNTTLGVVMSIRPWLDEAIALEQQAGELNQEPQHRSPWPDVQHGLYDGLRWFMREWLIKFAVKPRLEAAAIKYLPCDIHGKLLSSMRDHADGVRALARMAGWRAVRLWQALLEGALYSGALLKAADVVYTAGMLGVAFWGTPKEQRPALAWYVRELRVALLRCGVTWACASLCAAVFGLVDSGPVQAGTGYLVGDTLGGLFLYPALLQSMA